MHRLRFIANARDLGFPIEDIRTLLDLWSDRHRSSADVKALATAHAADLHQKAMRLEAMRAVLLDLAEHCHGDADRKSVGSGKSGPVRGDLGGRRSDKKNKTKN